MLALHVLSLSHPSTDLSCVRRVWPPASLSNVYHMTGGRFGDVNIGDGGDDMFDGGNELRVYVNGQWTPFPLKYTQTCEGEENEPARNDASYTTCMTDSTEPVFAAAFISPSASINGFRVSGNVGADGSGHFSANPGENPLVSTNTSLGPVYGYYKKIWGESTSHSYFASSEAATPDPSVNHLILVRGASSALTDVGITTDSDEHQLYFSTGVEQLYYLMWGGKLGVEYTSTDFQHVLDAVAQSCFGDDPPDAMPPPPPPTVMSDACNVACGDKKCYDFRNTQCSVISGPPLGCDCAGCCLLPDQALSPPPPSPTPSPQAPPPTPEACNAPCAGSTCGAFGGSDMRCTELKDTLGCDCTGCCASEANLQCVTSKWPAAKMPNLYAFLDGYAGRSIRDGGHDMYDYGNYLNVKVDQDWYQLLPYTQNCDGRFPSKVANEDAQTVEASKATYSTCKLLDGAQTRDTYGEIAAGTLFSAVFNSPDHMINGFTVNGNLGADGGGHMSHSTFTAARGVRGYFKQVYGAQHDASVNQLIISRSDLAPSSQTTTTNSGWQQTMFTRGVNTVYYLLWAGLEPSLVPGSDYAHGYKYERGQVQRLLDLVAESCFDYATGFPPNPPPPVALPPAPRECSTKMCGKQTCEAFRSTLCSEIKKQPWNCDCYGCCAEHLPPPPPSPPPSPPSAPPPALPETCSTPCAGSTCGAFQPYSCAEFQSELGCDCSGCCDTPLDARCVDREWPANLPGLYSFTSGTLSTYISDGGMDMYDHGNEIRVSVGGTWSNPLYYNQVCDGSTAATTRVGDAKYITCKFTNYRLPGYGAVFVAAVTSASGSIDGFMTNGNVGADGGGGQAANNVTGTMLIGKRGTSGYYKQIYHAQNDPSVNHLIFAQGANAANAKVTIGPTTDNDLHQVKFSGGVHTLYYILWAGKNGYKYEVENFQHVLDSLADACLPPSTYYSDPAEEGGGVNGFVIFLWVLIVGAFIGLAVAFTYGVCVKGWKLPGLSKRSSGRSQTNPTPSFDPGMGPISTTGQPLAAHDSATPYQPPGSA